MFSRLRSCFSHLNQSLLYGGASSLPNNIRRKLLKLKERINKSIFTTKINQRRFFRCHIWKTIIQTAKKKTCFCLQLFCVNHNFQHLCNYKSVLRPHYTAEKPFTIKYKIIIVCHSFCKCNLLLTMKRDCLVPLLDNLMYIDCGWLTPKFTKITCFFLPRNLSFFFNRKQYGRLFTHFNKSHVQTIYQ